MNESTFVFRSELNKKREGVANTIFHRTNCIFTSEAGGSDMQLLRGDSNVYGNQIVQHSCTLAERRRDSYRDSDGSIVPTPPLVSNVDRVTNQTFVEAVNLPCRGFTLVELLCVVMIIGVLAGLLLVTLSRAKEKANAVLCASRLREIGNSFSAYANDNNSFVPRGFVPRDAGEIYGNWGRIAQRYLDSKSFEARSPLWSFKILQCPSHPVELAETSYTINGYADGRILTREWCEPCKLSTVRRPGEVIYLADSSNRFPHSLRLEDDLYWPITMHVLLSVWELPGGIQERVAVSRHGNGVINALYFDGHVGVAQTKGMDIKQFDDGRRW